MSTWRKHSAFVMDKPGLQSNNSGVGRAGRHAEGDQQDGAESEVLARALCDNHLAGLGQELPADSEVAILNYPLVTAASRDPP